MKTAFANQQMYWIQSRKFSEQLQNSRVYSFSCYIFKHLEHIVFAFFKGFDNLYDVSVLSQIISNVNAQLAVWTQASHFIRWCKRFFRLLVVPSGKSLTEGTFLGIALALGTFVPTAIQMLGFGLFTFVLLWRRSVRQKSQSSKWIYLPFTLVFPLAVLFMFVAGATVTSVVPARSIFNFVLWSFYGLVLIVSFDIAARGDGENIIWPLLSSISIASIIGIVQYFTGWQTSKPWLDAKFEDEIVRIVGTFDNPNYFAEMIGLTLPIVLAFLLKNRRLRDKTLMLVYAALQSIALLLTWSRGAWLGFLFSFTIMAVIFDKRLLVLGLVVAVVVMTVAPPVVVQRLLSSFSMEDSSNYYRISIWRGSIALLKEYFFRGVGLGAESFAEMYPEFMIVQTPAIHSHSMYLQLLIEMGLFGFLAQTWFLFACMWIGIRSIFLDVGRGLTRWGHIGILSSGLAAIIGHMLQGVIDHTWYNPKITVVVWAWLGLIVGIGMRLNRYSSKKLNNKVVAS